jgi:predicted DNA-binding protein
MLDSSTGNLVQCMEVRLAPEQEARLAAVAASTGHSTDELVREAIELREQE